MTRSERRKNTRRDSLNLLSYHCVDANDNIVTQGVGRTLDIGEGGVLLETHTPIDPKHRISLFIAIEDDLVDIEGKVIHHAATAEGRFVTGISFLKPDDSARQIIQQSVQQSSHTGPRE